MKLFLTLSMALTFSFMVGCKAAHRKDAAKASKTQTASMKKDAKKETKIAGATTSGATTCSLANEKREIENRPASAGGCEVVYNKDGNSQTVATAQNDTSYCDQVVEKMKGKLETAGWSCN